MQLGKSDTTRSAHVRTSAIMVVSNAFEIELSNDTKLVASKTLEKQILKKNSLEERGSTRYYYAIRSEAFEAKIATSAFLDPFFSSNS